MFLHNISQITECLKTNKNILCQSSQNSLIIDNNLDNNNQNMQPQQYNQQSKFEGTKGMPKAFLFLHNVSKKNNIGNIVRTACAFNFQKIFYVSNRPEGSKKMKAMKQFHVFGNQGTFKQIDFHAFLNLDEARLYFKENGIRVCGVQIGPTSVPVHKHPFTGDTAFFLGNEGSGILPVHREICDFFVYIPQYTNKTASLNVSVAAGIIFHHFALWAQYPEAESFGQKYQYQDQPIGQPKALIKQKNQKKQQVSEQFLEQGFQQLPKYQNQ